MQQLAVCPKDGKDDQIQKVTAVVSDTSKGLLGKRLEPPHLRDEPVFISPPIPPLAIMITLIFSAGLAIIFAAIVGTTAPGSVVTFSIASYGGFFIGAIIARLINGKVAPRRFKEKKQEFVRIHRQWELEKDHYTQVILPNWNKVYYCHRCDIAFIPGDARGGRTPENMGDLLN
jgi:hypothetical protein